MHYNAPQSFFYCSGQKLLWMDVAKLISIWKEN